MLLFLPFLSFVWAAWSVLFYPDYIEFPGPVKCGERFK